MARWAGFAVPATDLLIIAGLCSGLALLPGPGWVLGVLSVALLLVGLTEADAWPDAALAVTGSGGVWVVTGVTRMMLSS